MSLARAGSFAARAARLFQNNSHYRAAAASQRVRRPTSLLAQPSSALSTSPVPEPDNAGASAGPRRPRRKSLAALGGFTYPGPRKLADIVKLPLLNAHGASRVREIWTEYHKHHANAIADVLSGEEFGLLMQRSERCPLFVVPIPRKGGYFTMLTQFQGRHCLVTYLEEYKTNPSGAQPYVTLTLFDDFVEKKGLALLRGDVTNQVTRNEASHILSTLKQFYLGPRKLYDTVVAFNEKASDFDFKNVLREAVVMRWLSGSKTGRTLLPCSSPTTSPGRRRGNECMAALQLTLVDLVDISLPCEGDERVSHGSSR